MTTIVMSVVLLVLVANVLIAVARIVLGPSGRDRLLGVVLAGTAGSAVLLVTSVLTGSAALRDAALVVVALATVVVVARVSSDREGVQERTGVGAALVDDRADRPGPERGGTG